MSSESKTRLLLRTSVKLLVMVAVLAFAWVLLGSWPESGHETTEVVHFDVTDMQPGEYRLVEWQQKPLFIVARKPEWESDLLNADASLYHDPASRKSLQMESAANPLRSAQSGWFVTLGLGTGMGCTLVLFEPDTRVAGLKAPGGFVDGCDQSHYDLAGRVYIDQQAKRNTVVPVWSLVDGEILVGGTSD